MVSTQTTTGPVRSVMYRSKVHTLQSCTIKCESTCPHTFLSVHPCKHGRRGGEAVVAHNESGMCKAGSIPANDALRRRGAKLVFFFAGDDALRSSVPFEISMWLKPHPENNCGIAVEGDALWRRLMEKKPPSSPSSSEAIDASALDASGACGLI